ncbi:dienelactone hydrolase family protein [Kiloniella laminariae]|uniref:Dienelactone hydrolase family protein n=1 Tax=Kiloniella laminariae TaxID=454162 RepID=A0ABT4LHW0_9PROT|nr:dienelactone hydrolase family protein [Kiloniella laminariae]MCZ4279597.1 dienelactone hydrolase family protein [Kiloniella laminariae]
MPVLLITDIWGRSPETEKLEQKLRGVDYDVQQLDSYQGETRSFACEADAYAAFMADCGHEVYAALVEEAVREVSQQSATKLVLLGFSAGASAAWRVAGSESKHPIHHLAGFYPGQIRNSLELSPSCPVTLVFPRVEEHFSVDAVIAELEKKPDVVCFKSAGEHGFMNPLSRNYLASEARKYRDILCEGEKLLDARGLRCAVAELVGEK